MQKGPKSRGSSSPAPIILCREYSATEILKSGCFLSFANVGVMGMVPREIPAVVAAAVAMNSRRFEWFGISDFASEWIVSVRSDKHRPVRESEYTSCDMEW